MKDIPLFKEMIITIVVGAVAASGSFVATQSSMQAQLEGLSNLPAQISGISDNLIALDKQVSVLTVQLESMQAREALQIDHMGRRISTIEDRIKNITSRLRDVESALPR